MRTGLILAAALAAASPTAAAADAPTYTRDVAPILFKHCVTCHRPGEVAPFALLDYKAAKSRAGQIKEITGRRRMPPWLPEPGPHRFLDERRLTDGELAVLAKWADSGRDEGDPKDMPPLPKFVSGWQLGEPDLVLKMEKKFTIPADGKDVYQAFVIKVPVDKLRWVRGFEFRPGNRKVVHHCNLLLDTSGEMRKRAEKGDGHSFATTAGLEARQMATGALGGWRPGTTPRFLPEGIARPVRPNADLVLNIHYHVIGKEVTDQSSVALYFTDAPTSKQTVSVPLFVSPDIGNGHLLDIPAGKKKHAIALDRVVPGDMTAYFVTVHAHYRLKDATVSATLPDGKELPLLEIKNWDFNQQDIYHYADRPKLPKGSRVNFVGHFDNSADNPNNPFSPPRDVRWGEGSTDEMFGMMLVGVPDSEESLQAFKAARAGFAGAATQGDPGAPPRLPPGGLAYPKQAKALLGEYDKNTDGKLTQEEVAAMPAPIRQRVEEALRKVLAGQQPPAPAPKEPKEAVKFPPGGFLIPEEAKIIREKFDKDKDGKLSQEEFDALPPEFKGKVEKALRGLKEKGGNAPPKGEKGFTLPPGGFPIPEEAKGVREKFDKDRDGKLSQEEFDALPPEFKAKVEKALREKGPPDKGANAPPKAGKDAFKLPPGGFILPEEAKGIREKFDKDKDGKLSQEEFDALPPEFKAKVEMALRKKGPPDKGPKDTPKGLTLPPGGFPIPEEAKGIREKFDKDKDGKLSQEEFDALPPEFKAKVEKALRGLLKDKEGKAQPKQGIRVPPGGFVLPNVKLKKIRDNFDKNKDGKLSQEEFDAIPPQVQEMLMPYLTGKYKAPSPPPPPEGSPQSRGGPAAGPGAGPRASLDGVFIRRGRPAPWV